jgi:hypothetical protein
MDVQILASLGAVGVAALTVGVNAITTVASLRTQRENTKRTLDSQLELARQQELALRDRSHGQALRDRRAPIYASVVSWVYPLLTALDDLSPQHAELDLDRWHLAASVEEELDLYASDLVHIRFSSLRALLTGITRGTRPAESPLLTWTELDGRIVATTEGRTERLEEWPERDGVRRLAMSKAIDLVATIRAEMQGQDSTGYFYTYRLDRE